MKARLKFLFMMALSAFAANAQIGYQVALMDQSTGKPRANETVSVTVTISDNTNKVICKSTQNATTNEFGMLALQVGDASTFNNVDWSKLPLWVSATVGGVTIAKSQILNVPVAEHSKHWGTLTKEMLTSKTWKYHYSTSGCIYDRTLVFRDNLTGYLRSILDLGINDYGHHDIEEFNFDFNYIINGDMILLNGTDGAHASFCVYFNGLIWNDDYEAVFK